ncbi:hypothetical protein OAF33_02180 [bacterium]|nr:hypothetical protein [bacterium]
MRISLFQGGRFERKYEESGAAEEVSEVRDLIEVGDIEGPSFRCMQVGAVRKDIQDDEPNAECDGPEASSLGEGRH